MKELFNGLHRIQNDMKKEVLNYKKESNEPELVEGISFDDVTFIDNFNEVSNTYKVNTIYNSMNNYIQVIDEVEICNYDPSQFVRYIESMKRTFTNRVNFLFTELSKKITVGVHEISKEMDTNSNDEVFLIHNYNPTYDCNNKFNTMITDINTYALMVLSGIGIDNTNSEMYEMLSMEYASEVMKQILFAHTPRDEKEIQYMFSLVNKLIYENANTFIQIVNRLCYTEGFVQKYIELLASYAKAHGDIPEELKIQ